MKLSIDVLLDYQFAETTDVVLQLEAAKIPEQSVLEEVLELPPLEHFARVAAQDDIGERLLLRLQGQLRVAYRAQVEIHRLLTDCMTLEAVSPHMLPGETIQYLMSSRYCPSDRFCSFVAATFGSVQGGARILAMRDWIEEHLTYSPGSSDSDTTAADTFITRRGVCRDYAHVLITFARAAGIPARLASVYALGVDPPDFHAVAEVFLGGEWHLIDATGMAKEADMAKIGIGRDASDVAFLTAFGSARLNFQSVSVSSVPDDIANET